MRRPADAAATAVTATTPAGAAAATDDAAAATDDAAAATGVGGRPLRATHSARERSRFFAIFSQLIWLIAGLIHPRFGGTLCNPRWRHLFAIVAVVVVVVVAKCASMEPDRFLHFLSFFFFFF